MAKLNVNGKSRTVTADPDTPLLWALRDDLKLTGTKFGCGVAQCGACAVIADGTTIPSCMTSVADAEKLKITTIEGLNGPIAAAVREAWIRLEVAQCGYCQSGQIIAATALLSKNGAPSDTDIDEAMENHICRCCTYARIRQAIQSARDGLKA
jgi:isoquinoline 1-oxidoreductase subunit alpha